jgi:hypothetical protein
MSTNGLTRLVACALIGVAGCGESPAPKTGPSTSTVNFLVNEEPAGAVGVGEARKGPADDAEITIVGRIGGSDKPFVSGLAAFTIVDPKVAPCAPDEGCPTPWDYCCGQSDVKENIATIKLIDATGKPLAQDARELLGVKELATVVVRGTAKRSEDGNLTVLAKQVYVRK